MAPPVSMSQKFSASDTPRPRPTVRRSQSLNLTDARVGSPGISPAKRSHDSLNPLTPSADSVQPSKCTTPETAKYNSKNRRDNSASSFFGRRLFSGRKQQRVPRGSSNTDGGQKRLVWSGERQHDSGQALPRQAVDSDSLCNPAPVMRNQNKTDTSGDVQVHSSSKSTLWYVNVETTEEEEDKLPSSASEDKPPLPEKKRLPNNAKENAVRSNPVEEKTGKHIHWSEEVLGLLVSGDGISSTSQSQLFTINEDSCRISSDSETDTLKDEETCQSEESKASPSESQLRCLITTNANHIINNRWTTAGLDVSNSSGQLEAVVCDGKSEAAVCDGKTEAAVCDGKSEAAVCDGKSEAAVCDGKSEAAVCDGKSEAAVCDGKSEAAVCDGKSEAAVCDGKSEAAVCDGKSEAAVCDVKSEAAVSDGKSEASTQLLPSISQELHNAPDQDEQTERVVTDTSSVLSSTSQDTLQEIPCTDLYSPDDSEMNTSRSMLELSVCRRQVSPTGRSSRTMSVYDRGRMKSPALNRSVSLSFGWRGSSENLENIKQLIFRKREQWRERRQSSKSLKDASRKDSKEDQPKDSAATKPPEDSHPATPDNKLYRWFSLRKSVNYDVERRSSTVANTDRTNSFSTTTNGTYVNTNNRMPKLPEEADMEHGGLFAENGGVFAHTFQRRHQPPTLPPMPTSLTPEQIKRRHIVASIVHSENNYVATLQRLVNEYKKPLEDSKPPVINSTKLTTLFHRVSEILQCHTLFRIALAECVRQWDREEKIGDVFVASFSKAIVLDIYSDFINNFSRAMEVAKQESKKKTAFADFLKMRQITSPDRLSFFGLMVKPVQRFPQFILFLQDLLKHTPQGHHDRMSLQLALTQLESLAEMLNERKREAEQYQAFRDTLKHINTKFALRGIQEGNRYLLRQDDMQQLEFNQGGLISKSKGRRLFLTNDLIICVTVVPKTSDEYGHQNERLSLKWAYPVTDVEIQDATSSPTLSRLLASGVKTGTMNTTRIAEETTGPNVDNLCQEMNDLMHDYEIVSRISTLVSSLKGTYNVSTGLTIEHLQQVSNTIQRALHIRDEQMAWVDACCLQFTVKNKEGREKEVFTFQTSNPVIKKDWVVELRLAQLALDSSNSPAWDVPEQEKRPSTKMPLFVKSIQVYSKPQNTEVRCGCCYTLTMPRPSRISGTGRHHTYLWLCSTDGVSSHITIYLMQQVGLREVVRLDLVEVCVTSLQHIPGITTATDDPTLRSHTVWIGTHSHKLIVYSGLDPERQTELGSTTVPATITAIKYHCDQVYVGLSSGCVQVYRRGSDGAWQLCDPLSITLGTHPVTALLPINTHVYAACGDNILVVDCFTAEVTKKFSVHHEGAGGVQLMAHSGIGLWIAQQNTSTICLYHTETFRHLQDINVASNVNRVLGERGIAASSINVTALLASRGLLWVGTNVGVALTIPLPRLEGVPIISGRANISYHAHKGPISFLLTLQPHARPHAALPELRPASRPSLQDGHSHSQQQDTARTHGTDDLRSFITTPTPVSRLEKQQSDGSLVPPRRVPPRLRQQLSSPVILRRKPRDTQQHVRRLSKTLPRGLGLGTLAGSQECDVYGLYGDLLNVHEYEDEPLVIGEGHLLSRYDSLRRSDPELAVPYQASTLDRRVRLKASRPRSLDLSTWSMDSRASSACTTSSGSEDGNGSCMSSVITTSTTSTVPIESTSMSTTSTTSRSTAAGRRKEKDESRTLMTIMGGRGYLNLRHPQEAQSSYENDKDAHVVVWEMKL